MQFTVNEHGIREMKPSTHSWLYNIIIGVNALEVIWHPRFTADVVPGHHWTQTRAVYIAGSEIETWSFRLQRVEHFVPLLS